MKNWKDSLSNYIALLMAVAGALLGIAAEVNLPSWVMTACIVVIAVGGAVVAWLTGKNHNLTRKAAAQLKKQLEAKDKGK